MSDVMLHGVLNMPPNLWSDCPFDISQRHGHYVEASKRIEELERQLAEAREDASILADTIKRMLYGEGDSIRNIHKIGSEALAAVKGTSI